MAGKWEIFIDTGGTFTDCIALFRKDEIRIRSSFFYLRFLGQDHSIAVNGQENMIADFKKALNISVFQQIGFKTRSTDHPARQS